MKVTIDTTYSPHTVIIEGSTITYCSDNSTFTNTAGESVVITSLLDNKK